MFTWRDRRRTVFIASSTNIGLKKCFDKNRVQLKDLIIRIFKINRVIQYVLSCYITTIRSYLTYCNSYLYKLMNISSSCHFWTTFRFLMKRQSSLWFSQTIFKRWINWDKSKIIFLNFLQYFDSNILWWGSAILQKLYFYYASFIKSILDINNYSHTQPHVLIAQLDSHVHI